MSQELHHFAQNCRLCGSTDFDLVLPLPATPVGDDYRAPERASEPQSLFPLDLYLCRSCGMAQLRDVVAPELLYGHFIYQTSISLGLPEHFRRYASEIIAWAAPDPGSLVIDIGSNDGTLLQAFREQKFRVLGVEPASAIASQATANGVETLPRFFNAQLAKEIRAQRGGAAIVTINNTIANLEDLDDVAIGIRELLEDRGVAVVETGYLLDLVQNELFDVIYHEHISYFAVKPMIPFFQKHGLELVDALRIPTKGGSIRLLVQKAGGPRSVAASMGELVKMEEAVGLHVHAGFQKLHAHLDECRERLATFLSEAKRKGQTIAGYGASVGSTTFIYRLGLAPFLDFIADENPAKHGLMAPGTGIPVLSADALNTRRPDLVLILSWRYRDPIVSKSQAYLANGGRIVCPWSRWESWPAHE